MEPIGGFLKHPKKPPQRKRRTERGDLFDYFLSYINPDRKKGGYPPVSHSRLAFMLKDISVQDLYGIRSMFDDRVKRNGTSAACKWFWWSLKSNIEEQ